MCTETYSLAWHCQGLMYHLYICYFLSCRAVASVVYSKQSCSCHSRLQTTMAPDTITLYQPVHQQLSPTSHFLWLPQVSYMYAVSVSMIQAIVCMYLELESLSQAEIRCPNFVNTDYEVYKWFKLWSMAIFMHTYFVVLSGCLEWHKAPKNCDLQHFNCLYNVLVGYLWNLDTSLILITSKRIISLINGT